MIYVDKTFIVPLSKLAKENIFIHKYVTKDFDFSVSLHYWECEFREMKPSINVSVLRIMGIISNFVKYNVQFMTKSFHMTISTF